MSSDPPMEPLLEDDTAASATGSHFSPLRRSTTLPVRRPSPGNQSTSSYPGLHRTKSRQFSRSTDASQPFLPPISEIPKPTPHDAKLQWQAFALSFVAVPAAAALFFENGGVIATDILLLGLGCLFLYWSVKWPWEWYHASQRRILVDYDLDYLEDEDFAVTDSPMGTDTEGQEPTTENMDSPGQTLKDTSTTSARERRQAQADASLRRYELLALLSCFLMPMAVAYLLHAIRPYLSSPSGGLVSNSNLTLFALAAEVRPFLHVFTLINSRTMHLQRIVAAPSTAHKTETSETTTFPVSELLERIQALEDKQLEVTPLPSPKGKENEDTEKKDKKEPVDKDAIISSATQSLQPQLDALNRAVRRYEKRATMQSVILDARLRDLDNRISDALSLAAAASRMAHRPGLLTWAFESTSNTVSKSVQSVVALPLLPYRMVQQTYVFLLGGKPKKRNTKRVDHVKVKKSGMEVR